MHNILRYIRQNRIKIIFGIVAIIFFYSLLMTANDTYKTQPKTENDNIAEEQKTDGTIQLTNANCEKTITEFLDYCTKGNYEKAYTYLSKNCREKKYPSLEEFEKYCKNNTIKGKNYSINKKSNSYYTYEIILNNKLSTGKANSQSYTYTYKIEVDNGHEIRINIK